MGDFQGKNHKNANTLSLLTTKSLKTDNQTLILWQAARFKRGYY